MTKLKNDMDGKIKFGNLVMFLAEESFKGDMWEAIENFEEKIKETGRGIVYFGTARSDWDRIDIVNPPYFKDDAKFYAEYYDGFQAPFLVCEWKDDFEKMEKLLKTTDSSLYKKYQEYLACLD